MKLRNKKTGEIVEVESLYLTQTQELYLNYTNEENKQKVYMTDKIASFNLDWEDYEEPKNYWSIDCYSPDGLIYEFTGSSLDILENRKSIGNYFETKKEAEKAVEKLKAWKRLKDVGFKFTDWHRDICEVAIEAEIHDDETMEMITDLDLLFGGDDDN